MPTFEVVYVRVHKSARVEPTNRAYSDADPGRVCPTAAAAAAAAVVVVVAAADSAAAVLLTTFDFLKLRTPTSRIHITAYVRRCSFLLVQHTAVVVT